MDYPSEAGKPSAYFITWSCYSTWLHGEDKGSVDRHHNRFGDPYLPANEPQNRAERGRMKQDAYILDEARRRIVFESILDQARYCGWTLLAVHVRSTHVNVVLQADQSPEQVMNILKAYSSRALNQADVDIADCKRWTRHGSTRYLWRRESVGETVEYVVRKQGDPMQVFEAKLEGE
jgi:hypothetical protein